MNFEILKKAKKNDYFLFFLQRKRGNKTVTYRYDYIISDKIKTIVRNDVSKYHEVVKCNRKKFIEKVKGTERQHKKNEYFFSIK